MSESLKKYFLSNCGVNFVDILQLRFPHYIREDVVNLLVKMIERGQGGGVCFPDMSTLNLAEKNPSFKSLLRDKMVILNDGAGLAWIAKRRGSPFPDNLNGTDLCPLLFTKAPPKIRIFLIGGKPGTAERARKKLVHQYPNLNFIGSHHGYFIGDDERQVIDLLKESKPQLVLVGMGNPLQVFFINRCLDDPAMKNTIFLAVGGFMHYYSGELARAPVWVRKLSLEWLYITLQQPHKIKRYFIGIPMFIFNCLRAERNNRHDFTPVN